MKSYEEIYGQMKQALTQKTGTAISEGGDMALRLSAVAAELESLWSQAEWTRRQCFPQYASGDFLDSHAEMRGLCRGAAGRAKGIMRFETDEARTQTIYIPEGTVCLNAAGAEFLTDEQARIEAGALFCTVGATARDAGSSGNAPAESVTYMALAPAGVLRCFNPAAFKGGTDGESDEGLRARVLESYKSLPNGSNRAYYESVALETETIAAAVVIPKARGLGTVDIYVAAETGLPDEAAVAAVAARLEAEREICVDVQVAAPAAVSVPVSVEIEVSENSDFDAVAAEVKAALEAYFSGRLLGKRVLRARLGSVIIGVKGVENYNLLLPSADVEIQKNQLPTAGAITVTEG